MWSEKGNLLTFDTAVKEEFLKLDPVSFYTISNWADKRCATVEMISLFNSSWKLFDNPLTCPINDDRSRQIHARLLL